MKNYEGYTFYEGYVLLSGIKSYITYEYTGYDQYIKKRTSMRLVEGRKLIYDCINQGGHRCIRVFLEHKCPGYTCGKDDVYSDTAYIVAIEENKDNLKKWFRLLPF